MTLHFTEDEFSRRQHAARAAISQAGLDAILLFAPESHYWLTGYDTFGFAMFQSMVMTASGDIHLLTRAPDLRQARHTSTLDDQHIHIWHEVEGANPAQDLARLLATLGVATGRIGYESKTVGLTDFNGRMLHHEIAGLEDASDIFPALRRVKSAAEIGMHRKAA
ncbi:MAG: aminopeptidase P family N-terminal domain-containing protein, partial [Alphaproteobacteria bacterium]